MTIKTLTVCLILMIAATSVPTARGGQQQQLQSPATNAWSVISAVPPGDDLVVRLKSGKTVSGRLRAVSDAGLTLTRGGRTIDVNQPEVARVQRILGGSVSKATAIGAGVGGAAGAAVGAGLGAAFSESGDGAGVVAATTFALAGLGAGIGAGAGAIAGLIRKKRVLIYEAP